MPRAQANVGGDAGMRQLYSMFRVNPNAFPGTSPGAFADEANNEIAQTTAEHNATSPEKLGEQDLLDQADQRNEVGIRSGLAEAESVRQARDMGYGGSFPLRDQQESLARAALYAKLAPEKMKLEAALADKEAARTFTAGQNQNKSDAAMERVKVGVQAKQRPAASNLNAVTNARKAMDAAEPGVLGKMFGAKNKQKPVFDQAVGNALSSLNPDAVGAARAIMAKSPEADVFEGLSAIGEDSLSPDEIQQVHQALSIMRGK